MLEDRCVWLVDPLTGEKTAQFSPIYVYDSFTGEKMEESTHDTYNNSFTLEPLDAQGPTMEAPNIIKNYVVRLTVPSSLTVSLTQPTVFKAQATTKCGTQEVSCEPMVIDGDLSFTLADNGWIASATGEVSVLLKYSFKLDTGNTGSVYSAPILVTVTE